jgi:hypothetical protein
VGQPGSVVGGAATGGEDDDGIGARLGQPSGDRDSVDVGELDVEQHQFRPEDVHGGQCALSVDRLAHDVEASIFEHALGHAPEASVVVDDDHGRCHAVMLAPSHRAWQQGYPRIRDSPDDRRVAHP